MATRFHLLIGSTILLAGLVLGACSPGTPSSPTPVASTPTKPAAQATVVQQKSAEDAAWEKVVAAAKTEGKLTFYATSPFTGDVNQALTDAFKRKYGIFVDILVGNGSSWGERLKTEKRVNQQVGDVIFASMAWAMNYRADGLADAVPELPILRAKNIWTVHPLQVDPEARLILVFINEHHPFANANLLKPEDEPKSYYDFLQPKWKGKKIVIEDPRVSSLEYLHFTPLTNAGAMKWDFFTDLAKQEPLISIGGGRTEEMLSRGEAIVSLSSPDLRIGPLVNQGIPLKSLSMKEGDTANLSPMMALKGAPHPNAARLFINWFLEGEGANILAKTGSHSVNATVPDVRPDAIKSKSPKLVVTTLKDAEDMGKFQREGLVTQLLGIK